METVYLHPGMQKTGSTSIQNALNGFDDGRTRFADFGNPNHSTPLQTLGANEDHLIGTHARLGRTLEESAQLKKEYRKALNAELARPVQNLILSGEGVCNLATEELHRLLRLIEPKVTRVIVIGYFRDPFGYVSSLFQQRVKSGKKNFFPMISAGEPIEPGYRSSFEKFTQRFARSDLQLVDFDVVKNQPGSIVADFCRRVGVNPSSLATEHANSSLSSEAIGALFLFNLRGVESIGSLPRMKARDRLITVLQEALPGRFALDRGFISGHLDVADCAWMEGAARATFDLKSSGPRGIASKEDLIDLGHSAKPGLQRAMEQLQLGYGSKETSLELLNRMFEHFQDAVVATAS